LNRAAVVEVSAATRALTPAEHRCDRPAWVRAGVGGVGAGVGAGVGVESGVGAGVGADAWVQVGAGGCRWVQV